MADTLEGLVLKCETHLEKMGTVLHTLKTSARDIPDADEVQCLRQLDLALRIASDTFEVCINQVQKDKQEN